MGYGEVAGWRFEKRVVSCVVYLLMPIHTYLDTDGLCAPSSRESPLATETAAALGTLWAARIVVRLADASRSPRNIATR